jgi:hypothetical protein
MKYGDKLYIVTRRDLEKGPQAVQSIQTSRGRKRMVRSF